MARKGRSPWENGYIESFNGKLRDELLDREIFDTVLEAKVLLTDWKREYNAVRPSEGRTRGQAKYRMQYPLIEIDLEKIRKNAEVITSLCAAHNIGVAGVTKVVCGSPYVAKAFLAGGVKQIADSRLENISRLRDNGITCQILLLRTPMLSEVERVVSLADISLNSELSTIEALSKAALKLNKVHKIILMVDVGDLREGILPEDAEKITEGILQLEGVKLEGVGTNLICYGGVVPTIENMSMLVEVADRIENKFGIEFNIISGGNTSNLGLVSKGKMPGKINHLRIGEGILLGVDTVSREPLPGTFQDTFTLKAEVIELKEKPTVPGGETAQDAFGNVPHFEDQGVRERAILGIGREDIDPESIAPVDPDIKIMGSSSDHLLIDTHDSRKEYGVGDVVPFLTGYGALLAAMTSQYVSKKYISASRRVPKKKVAILGVPVYFGADTKGVELGPECIRNASLSEALEGLGFEVVDLGNVTVEEESSEPADPRIKHVREVVSACEAVSERVTEIVEEGSIPLVLGGDHSLTIGVLAGIRRIKDNIGMVYFDAHGDYNTASTTITKDAHGMVVSACVGLGNGPLANCGGICPKLEQENIVMIGLRDIDPLEKENLMKSRIHIFTMEDIDLIGMREVINQTIERLSHCSDGIYVSFDLDVVDSKEAPGVSVPVHGGISYRETHLAMELLHKSGLPSFMDVVEVNPNLDVRDTTSRLAVEFICSLLGKRIIR